MKVMVFMVLILFSLFFIGCENSYSITKGYSDITVSIDSKISTITLNDIIINNNGKTYKVSTDSYFYYGTIQKSTMLGNLTAYFQFSVPYEKSEYYLTINDSALTWVLKNTEGVIVNQGNYKY